MKITFEDTKKEIKTHHYFSDLKDGEYYCDGIALWGKEGEIYGSSKIFRLSENDPDFIGENTRDTYVPGPNYRKVRIKEIVVEEVV